MRESKQKQNKLTGEFDVLEKLGLTGSKIFETAELDEKAESIKPEKQVSHEDTLQAIDALAQKLSERDANTELLNSELQAKNEKLAELSLALDSNNEAIEILKNQVAEKENALLESNQAAEKLRQEQEELSQRLVKLESVLTTVSGKTEPAKEGNMEVLGTGSEESRRFDKLVNQAQNINFVSRKLASGGGSYRYSQDADKFWIQNRDKISQGIEAELRDAGYLQGGNAAVTQDLTLVSDIPSTAFQHLSSMLRTTAYPELILWQFAAQNTQLGIRPGNGAKNFAFPRYSQLAPPASKSARTLSAGTPINAGNFAFQESNKAVEILELGLGKDANNVPIGISEFASAFSLTDLERLAEANIIRDYLATKNVALQEEIFRANVQLYNNGGNIVTTPGAVLTDGQLTREYLTAAYTYTRKQRTVSALPDGCYILITNPDGVGQILKGMTEQERYMNTSTAVDIVGRYLAESRSNFVGGMEVSGYVGKFNGFHVFEQNNFGVGPVADDVGAFTEAIGATPTNMTTVQSFVMGTEAIGWATAMPPQIRMGETTDFGRQMRLLWISHENSVSLDVRNDTNETMRVIGLRHTVDKVA